MIALTAEDFLSKAERERVAQAIGEAERLTSGEIRVHLEDHIEDDGLDMPPSCSRSSACTAPTSATAC